MRLGYAGSKIRTEDPNACPKHCHSGLRRKQRPHVCCQSCHIHIAQLALPVLRLEHTSQHRSLTHISISSLAPCMSAGELPFVPGQGGLTRLNVSPD
eukprot:scaffold50_cov420-Prasinococcus_capsulatus_cf.AAC.21